MKKVFVSLLLIFSLTSYAQTQLDLLAFKALNKYRIDHGCKPLVFNSTVWKAANHHSIYLSENGYPYDYVASSGHFELKLTYPSDRLEYYGVPCSYSGECIAYWGGSDSDEENANKAISMWDSSPGHKRGMLTKEATRVAISIVGEYWEKLISYTYKGKLIERTLSGTRYFATLLVVRPLLVR